MIRGELYVREPNQIRYNENLVTYAPSGSSTERDVTIFVTFHHVRGSEVVRVEDFGVRLQIRAMMRDHGRYRNVGALR